MNGRFDVYRRLIAYLRPYWIRAAIAYTCMFIAVALGLVVPQIIKRAIDQGLAAGEPQALFAAGALILGIAVVRGTVAFGQRYYGLWLTHRVAFDLRNEFYDRVQHLPFSFHDKAHTGDLMSRATSDITESERFVGVGLMDLVSTLLLAFGVLVAMFWESSTLAIIAMGPILLLIAVTIRFGGVVRPMFKLIQEQMGVLSTTMQESMTGINVVKAFAREPHEMAKFNAKNEEWFERRFKVIKVWANNWPLFTFLLSISIFLLLWYGAPLVLAGGLTVGSLFALVSYVLMLNGPVQRLGFLVNLAATASASANRIFEMIDMPTDIVEKQDALPVSDIAGGIVFEDVSFAYSSEDANVLSDISFEVQPGETIALIGPTGSGKSTVINLLPRFYDPNNGRILVDGIDIRDMHIPSLRSQFGTVLQDPFLFSSTIAENIAYSDPAAPRDAIEDVARIANAHEFIMGFPDGYDTVVGERGVTLSGGQKQRIAIARALLRDPRILILDDSTSSVDTETEHLIQQALTLLMENATTFVIAQRLLTLKNADSILVLDEGRIVERGSHEDLLANHGLYREIYDLQLKDQEEVQQLALGD